MRLCPTLAFAAALVAVASPLYAQEQGGNGVTISRPWARATPGGAKVGAAYLEITSAAGDKLVAVSSPVAAAVELHSQSENNGVMKMRRLETIEIAPGKPHVLKPGGDHIMLLGLKEPLQAGGVLPFTLSFETAGKIEVDATIEPIGATAP